MRNLLAAVCALLVELTICGSAQASPMDSITWQPYAGSWFENNTIGSVTIGSPITISPTSPNGGVSITTTPAIFLINQGSFFALEVPFSTTRAGILAPGGFDIFDIVFQNQTVWSVASWASANNLNLGGTNYNGSFFTEQNNSNTNPLSVQNTAVTAGELGFIYSGNIITSYFNDGTGWSQIGNPNSTLGSTGPLVFELEAQDMNSDPFSVVVPEVLISTVNPVPEPSSFFLFGFGLVVLVLYRGQAGMRLAHFGRMLACASGAGRRLPVWRA